MRLIDADELDITTITTDDYSGNEVLDVVMKEDIDDAPTVNAIHIPNGATNGDMIKAMFPPIKIYENNEFMFGVQGMAFNHETYSNLFFKDWWNALYKGGKE